MYGPEAGFEGCRHLLLAAEPVERQRPKRALCATGYRVTDVASLRESERLARTFCFDAVVLSACLAGLLPGSSACFEPSLTILLEAPKTVGDSPDERGRRDQRLIDRRAGVAWSSFSGRKRAADFHGITALLPDMKKLAAG